MMIAPYAAFLGWTGGEATFEALDDLVDAHGTLREPQDPELSGQRPGTLQGVLGSQQVAVSLPLRIHEPGDTEGIV